MRRPSVVPLLLLSALLAPSLCSQPELATSDDSGPVKLLTTKPKPNSNAYIKSDMPLVIRCKYNESLATDDSVSLEWFFIEGVYTKEEANKDDEDGENLSSEAEETPVKQSLLSVDTDGSSILTLDHTSDRGTYICRAGPEESRFYVNYYFKLEKLPRSYTVMNGDDLLLPCKLKDSSLKQGNPQYTWYIKSGDLDSPTDKEGHGEQLVPNTTVANGLEPHIKFLNSSTAPGITVKIENAVYEDRAWYRCVVNNEYGQEEFEDTLVRVKYRYGALYPFLGIVAEVIVLCLFIFICERRKSNKEIEEEDEDYNGSAHGGQQGNSNLRHRVR